MASLLILVALGGCGDPAPAEKDRATVTDKVAALPVWPRGPDAPISDDEILTAVARPFTRADQERMEGKREVLGTRNGVRVVVDYPCNDLCPSSTARILHLDIEPGPACRRAGGLVRLETVPLPAAAGFAPFCVPAILVERKIDQTVRFEQGT